MPVRVQIVDDHHLFAEAIGSVIRELPEYEVTSISVTGPQAISNAQLHQPDIVLLDYHLPGYSAEQLIPRIRSVSPHSRVIILTSDTSEASLVKGLQAGVQGYLTKEKALDDVVQALRSVAEGRPVLTPEQLAASHVAAATGEAEVLTQREIEILRLLARGKDTLAIADDLVISANTVRTHVQNIFTKLGAHSKLEVVTIARDRGLVQ